MSVTDILNIQDDIEIDAENIFSNDNIILKETLNGSQHKGNVLYSTNNAQMSHIWSKIIEAAGRFTLHFSSDIFLAHDRMTSEFTNDGLETKNYLFGFRESGVDNLRQFKERVESNRSLYDYGYYRKIYLLSLRETGDEKNILEMRLIDLTP